MGSPPEVTVRGLLQQLVDGLVGPTSIQAQTLAEIRYLNTRLWGSTAEAPVVAPALGPDLRAAMYITDQGSFPQQERRLVEYAQRAGGNDSQVTAAARLASIATAAAGIQGNTGLANQQLGGSGGLLPGVGEYAETAASLLGAILGALSRGVVGESAVDYLDLIAGRAATQNTLTTVNDAAIIALLECVCDNTLPPASFSPPAAFDPDKCDTGTTLIATIDYTGNLVQGGIGSDYSYTITVESGNSEWSVVTEPQGTRQLLRLAQAEVSRNVFVLFELSAEFAGTFGASGVPVPLFPVGGPGRPTEGFPGPNCWPYTHYASSSQDPDDNIAYTFPISYSGGPSNQPAGMVRAYIVNPPSS